MGEYSFMSGGYVERPEKRYWKYGFYVNPEDPRLWVPRPSRPQSRTVNLGHPRGMTVLAAMLFGPLLFTLLILAVVTLILVNTLPPGKFF